MSDNKGTAIVVLVASSRTGREIVQQGLERGYKVRAVVRSEAKFRSLVKPSMCDNANLTIHACNLDSVEDLIPAISGAQVVFVTTGGTENTRPAYINQDLVSTILASLDEIDKQNRPGRLVLLSSETISELTQRDNPVRYWITREKLMRPIFEDLLQTQSILKKNKNRISYTFIQPSGLMEAPRTNGPVKLVTNQKVTAIAYGDLASGMLDAGFDDSCRNQIRGVVSEVRPKITWSSIRTQRQEATKMFGRFVIMPVIRAGLLVGLGWILKSKFFYEKTFEFYGYRF